MHMGPILLFSMGMAGLLVVSTKPVAQRARANSITLFISTRKVSHDSMTSLYRGRIFYLQTSLPLLRRLLKLDSWSDID